MNLEVKKFLVKKENESTTEGDIAEATGLKLSEVQDEVQQLYNGGYVKVGSGENGRQVFVLPKLRVEA